MQRRILDETVLTTMPPRAWVVAAALLVPLAAFATYAGGTPQLWAPVPFLSFTAYMAGLGPAAALLPGVAFLAWTPQLRRAEQRIPRRSLALLVAAAALSVWYGVAAWPYGLRHQGRGYTVAVDAITAAWFVVLAGLAAWAWRRPSYARSLAFHWVFFAWLAWYAFPYLGELL